MGPPAIEKHYSPAEVAERLSVDERTIRRWIADGKLASFKVGGHLIRIPESSVHDLLVEQRTVTADDLALERIKKVLTDTGYVPEDEVDTLAAKIVVAFTGKDHAE